MSLKPPKKSDAGRPWMASRADRARKISPEYHLIVTEGEKTEPLYFERVKEIINQQYKVILKTKFVYYAVRRLQISSRIPLLRISILRIQKTRIMPTSVRRLLRMKRSSSMLLTIRHRS